ncbi:MAG TPA: LacI family DNA-binding transcriptional regulator [Anaerolineales bacterium]|nr:LacI family DNA-binding transcriptional regulator [Anaerolineales bacterium]
MVTIRDVAKRAGVGVGTVSRVLNNSANVSAQTRLQVLAVIDELNFRPNPIAQRLPRQETLTIGVILPFFTFPFFVNILEGIHAEISEAGYDLLVMNVDSPEKSEQYFGKAVFGRRFDGVIVVTLPLSDQYVELFAKNDLPVVLVDSFHPQISAITVNNVVGGALATQHLIDKGHTKIAYIGDNQNDLFGFHTTQLRLHGYQQTLRDNGIAPNPNWIFQGNQGKGSGVQGANYLLSQDPTPTAIFAYSDTVALGVVEVAEERGLRYPNDFALIGFDDIEISQYIGLTTVRQPMQEMGKQGARQLINLLAHPSDVKAIELPLQLVERKSTNFIRG